MKIILKPKILLIEGQRDVLTAMTFLLERAALCVFGARTGMDGIRLSQKEEFDLVILDVDLPDRSGFEVCTWLKQDFRFVRTPFIFVSEGWDEEKRNRALELGAADCVDKTSDAPAFVQRILSQVKTTRTWPDKNVPDL